MESVVFWFFVVVFLRKYKKEPGHLKIDTSILAY